MHSISLKRVPAASLWYMILFTTLHMASSLAVAEPTYDANDLFNMSLDELMEVPVVFSSSKRMQPITEAASSVEIITAEDIRQSGAITLADVLRNVAGVQVRETSTSSHVIGVRGFADGQHVLVTLDGNSTYLHCMNVTYFDLIPVTLEEIERIEIVKGPQGVFYGGSAFSGVINIVTKSPKQLEGTQLNAGIGNHHASRGNVLHGGRWKNWEYKAGVDFFESDYLSPPRAPFMNEDTLTGRGFGRIVYRFDEDSSASADVRQSYADDAIARHAEDVRNTYLTLRYDQPNFWIRGFYNGQTKGIFQKTLGAQTTAYEFETMRTFNWGKNITSIGAFAKTVDLEFTGNVTGTRSDSSIDNYALKAENEYHATERLILTLGGRADHFSEVGWLGLGRGSIIYKLTEAQRLGATVSSGYYLPSIVQLYGLGDVLPFTFSPALREEEIISYELSYYNQVSKRLRLRSALFYNDYRGLIPYDLSVVPDNSIEAHQRGLELGLDFTVAPWLTGFANYTYQTMHRSDLGDLAVNPENMANVGLRARSGKWSSTVTLHYVDRFYEIFDAANPPVLGRLAEPQRVDSYITADARIAYRVNDHLKLALTASNLFNDEHFESNLTGGTINADLVDRRIMAHASYTF